MEKNKNLRNDMKQTIVNLALKGYSLGKISSIVNRPHSTVNCIVNKFRYNGSTRNLPKQPRGKKLNEREERFILTEVRINPKVSVMKIRALVENLSGKHISDQTVRRVLWQNGYWGCIPKKRPYESKRIVLPDFNLPFYLRKYVH